MLLFWNNVRAKLTDDFSFVKQPVGGSMLTPIGHNLGYLLIRLRPFAFCLLPFAFPPMVGFAFPMRVTEVSIEKPWPLCYFANRDQNREFDSGISVIMQLILLVKGFQ